MLIFYNSEQLKQNPTNPNTGPFLALIIAKSTPGNQWPGGDVNQQERENTVAQITNINGSPAVRTGQRTGASSPDGFQDTLSNVLDETSGSRTGGSPIAPLGEPQAVNFSREITPVGTGIVEQTDSLLTLLESYADGLEDPDTSLKDLSSLVDRIQEEAEKLMVSTDGSATAENQLKDIAEQTALTANMEYIKFQRGDYL